MSTIRKGLMATCGLGPVLYCAVAALTVAAVLAACEPTPVVRSTELSVALFPYIPDAAGDEHAALLAHLEHEFEKDNRDVDLLLRPMDQTVDFYDIERLRAWLSGSDDSNYDLVEIDAVILGDLQSEGLIQPWDVTLATEDWHPAAVEAVRIDGKVYGFPHLLCAHFVFARDSAVTRSESVSELLEKIRGASESARIGGDILGSWNLPALYIDSWFDSHLDRDPAEALHGSLDRSVLADLRRLSDLCALGDGNPCLDGTYDNSNRAAEDFGAGELDVLLGYSERLHFALKAAEDDDAIHLGVAPLGSGNNPIVFVDALVLRTGAPKPVVDAAMRFAYFLNSVSVQESVLMSSDAAPGAIPRYLIPASASAYTSKLVAGDRYYSEIRREVASAVAYPNRGLRERRVEMRDSILTALED